MIQNAKKLFGKTGFLTLFLLFGLILLSAPVLAQKPDLECDNIAGCALGALDKTLAAGKVIENPSIAPNLPELIASAINIALGLIGILFLILVIIGGIQWMTAGGNEDKVTKANQMLRQSAIGIVIVIFSFLLTNFIIFRIIEKTQIQNTSSISQPAGNP